MEKSPIVSRYFAKSLYFAIRRRAGEFPISSSSNEGSIPSGQGFRRHRLFPKRASRSSQHGHDMRALHIFEVPSSVCF